MLGWLLGIGTGLLGVAVTGGWYEYLLIGADDLAHFINREGWEAVQIIPPDPRRERFGEGSAYLRRPRVRLP